MEFQQLASDALADAVDGLLQGATADSRPGLSPGNDAESRLRFVAVIGFAGTEVRGTLGIAANEEGLAAVRGIFGAPEADTSDGDCLGEFANLVLGQVKRSWAARGVGITLSTPLILRGLELEVCNDIKGGQRFEHEVRFGESRVTAWLDTQLPWGSEVRLSAPTAPAIAEGEALIF